jgi:kynurenine formamidase
MKNIEARRVRFVDLSLTLEDTRAWAPWWAKNAVKYQTHAFGRLAIWLLFRLPKKFLPNQLGWANEEIRLSTHGTTHVDAPWHYGPLSEGRPARTIDEMPLEWFFQDGVVLDFRHKPSTDGITPDDLKTSLKKINHTLQPGQIVLIMTGADQIDGTLAYFDRGPGVTAEATRWLIQQGIRVMGTDAWGWDRPLKTMARMAKETKDLRFFWEAHFVGQELEYCHMERLAHLEQLPANGFKVCCFPLKVKRGSAGPARVVAMVPEI